MGKRKRPVAQLAEQRSPKPQVGGSIPSWPARLISGPIQNVVRFFKEVRTEILKVSWPTRQEVFQTALIVAIMVFVCCIFLWCIDSLILRFIKVLMGQRN